MKFIARTTRLSVGPENATMFTLGLINIELENEAAGEFVVISQLGDGADDKGVAIDPDGWPVLREAIDKMIAECREDEK